MGPEVCSATIAVYKGKLPLVEDDTFVRFRALLRKEKRTTARVTLIGTFFAGEPSEPGLRGYGHFGCCTLLAIERIERFERVGR